MDGELAAPLLTAKRADQDLVNAMSEDSRLMLEAKEVLDAKSKEINRRYLAGEINPGQAAESTQEVDKQRKALGMVNKTDWNTWRKVQGWRFLERLCKDGSGPPGWAVAPDGVTTNAALVMGPSILLLRLSSLVLMATRCLAFAVAAKGFSQSPGVWLLAVPSLCLALFADADATRHLMVPYLARVDDAEIVPFKVFGLFTVRTENMWQWGAFVFFSSLAAVAGNFSTSLAAGVLLHGGVFEETDSSSVPYLKASFIALWFLKLGGFIYPLVTTVRKQELGKESTCNKAGLAGAGQSLAGEQYNDDVALALAESAGAAALQSLATKFARAHVITTPAVELAAKTANSMAWRVGGSLLLAKLPLCFAQLFQVLLFRADSDTEQRLKPGEVKVLLNMAIGVPLSLMQLLTIVDFDGVAAALRRRVEVARETQEWFHTAGAEQREAFRGMAGSEQVMRERERAYHLVHRLLVLSRFCGLLLALSAAGTSISIVLVLWTHGMPKVASFF